MNAVMEAILSRRSIRKFKTDPVPEEILQDVAQAGLHAPSGMGKKTWHFVVLTNRELIDELAEAIRLELGRDQYDMYRPSALVIPSNLRDNPHGKEDNACALENIFLAAHSYGVGSVWINQLQGICDSQRIRPILDRIGVPSDHVVYGMAALGYPDIVGMYRKGGEVTFVR
ncbi:MAG: nitroreductase [Lachnospiraceae bacterium]|nr:nitroreductase [Lachnospiraceae bacterium]